MKVVGKYPRARIALINPHLPYVSMQRVPLPEPIKKRSNADGWQTIIGEQAARFGLITTPEHDATERDFDRLSYDSTSPCSL